MPRARMEASRAGARRRCTSAACRQKAMSSGGLEAMKRMHMGGLEVNQEEDDPKVAHEDWDTSECNIGKR